MKRFIEGETRTQVMLLPECLDDYVTEENPVRVVDVFVDELDLGALGFEGVDPAATGRPAYHPAILLKINIYGYLNRIQSTRRLEREAQRNVELMWLTGRLAPDFKTIADFRKDNGKAIRSVCRQTGKERRVKRWEHEAVIDAMQARLEHDPGKMKVRRQTVEHPFGTLKYWMGATHFLTKTLPRVSTEMSLHVLAYNLKRMMSIFGIAGLLEAIRA
ncbi:transposase [Pseudomonas fluorescens]